MKLKQVEPVIEKIGETKFYITPFPAFKAANLTGELASVLAPLLGALAPLIPDGYTGESEDDSGGGLMDIDAKKAADAMSNVTGLDGDKIEKLMKKLLLGGHIRAEVENDDGELEPTRLDQDLADEIFCGDVQDMFILCFHVIKLNFNGFFKKLGTQSGKGGLAEVRSKRKIL